LLVKLNILLRRQSPCSRLLGSPFFPPAYAAPLNSLPTALLKTSFVAHFFTPYLQRPCYLEAPGSPAWQSLTARPIRKKFFSVEKCRFRAFSRKIPFSTLLLGEATTTFHLSSQLLKGIQTTLKASSSFN